MRNLNKNKTHIVALNYVGKTPIIKDGYETGEYNIVYSDEIHLKAHVSGAKGTAEIQMFGMDVLYDKTIVITRNECDALGIDENTVFFIDKKPSYTDKKMPLYDYKVAKISRTLNEAVIAVSQVRNEK